MKSPIYFFTLLLFSLMFTACGGGGGGGGTTDTTPPDTSITATPASVSNSANASFSFSATETSSTFEISLDSAAYITATSPHTFSGLSDGTHTVTIRATDTAGNVDASPASYNWTIDTTIPDTIISTTPAVISNASTASFEFTSTEAGSSFEISLDNAIYITATSPFTFSGLSDGPHTVNIRATDAAGNVDATPSSYNWTVMLPALVVSNCAFTTGDSTQDMTTGRAIFTKSHTLGSPVYRVLTSRQLSDTSAVTIDYMVHEPASTPKAIVVLIAGGGLDTGITGTVDGGAPSNSRGNFLVRSAHRYQSQGYRVITIDRPSDFANYGPFNVNFDDYRNSMQHAVDIAAILKRENTTQLDVIISGTSRGAISAAAMNTLAAGIELSSPLTGGATGHPIGSANLPISRIQRASNILLHTNDTCSVTLPSASRTLYNDLVAAGNIVQADEVTGGFRDTDRNDVCGAFDFHGFAGIEMCAVLKETSWADQVVTAISSNSAPEANNLAVTQGDAITLTASDANGDQLKYALPYSTSSLQATVSTTEAGIVTYTPPAGTSSGAVDTFAFTVTDSKGGVSTAVVSVTLN